MAPLAFRLGGPVGCVKAGVGQARERAGRAALGNAVPVPVDDGGAMPQCRRPQGPN